MLCGGSNILSEPLQPPTRFEVVETDSTKLYKPLTRFAAVEADPSNH